MAIFEPLFNELNTAGIRYVVVGGLAVVLHGHARLTADVDLVIDLDPGPARQAIDALVRLGLEPRAPVNPMDFADAEIRGQWIRDRGMQVFSMFDRDNPLRSVDLFVDHPIPFEELWERSETAALAATTVRIASIPDLIELKQLAGRPQDRDDIAHLKSILEQRKHRNG